MIITQDGFKMLLDIDSIRAVRVLLKLVEMSEEEGAISVKLEELATVLKLKNKANVSVAVNQLVKLNCITKSYENKKTKYYINPKFFLTQKGYDTLKQQYENSFFENFMKKISGGSGNE